MFKNWKIKKEDYNAIIQDENGNLQENPLIKEYSEVAEWCNESQEYTIVDDGEYFKVEAIPEPTEEELAERVRNLRNDYLEQYVDPVVSNPLRWAELTEDEQNLIKDYRQYLLDIPETEEFPHIEVLTYDEWCDKK